QPKVLMSPLWEWKQQLFAETTSADTSAVVVPLSTLKAVVYGEVAITTQSCHFSELSICCYLEPFLSTCHQSKDNSS
ncbi:hypothetical protein HID58_069627, partial [Brassica napus]